MKFLPFLLLSLLLFAGEDTESHSRISLWREGAQNLSQAKPVPKQLNLQSLAAGVLEDRFDLWGGVQEDLKGCGCPTQPEPILESRAVYSPALNIYDSIEELGEACAEQIVALIQERRGKPVVLGLATGNTPIPLYRSLKKKLKGLDLSQLVTFNLDEYVEIPPRSSQLLSLLYVRSVV